MKPRERILAVAFAAILVLVIVVPRFIGSGSPWSSRQAKLESLKTRLAAAEALARRQHNSSRWLAEMTDRTLPPDHSRAQALYQTALTSLLGDLGVSGALVSPAGVRPEGDNLAFISAELDFRTDQQGVARVLEAIRSASIPQRVVQLSIEKTDLEKPTELSVRMTLEAVSLRWSPPRDRLVLMSPEAVPAAPVMAGGLLRYFPVPDSEPHTPPSIPNNLSKGPVTVPVSPAHEIVLVALLGNARGTEAWLYDRLTGESIVISESASLDFLGLRGEVKDVNHEMLVVSVDGKVRQLRLGDMLDK